MSEENRILVYNPNYGEGAISRLRGQLKVRWDQPVRAIPARSAHDLVRLGGMFYAEEVAACAKRFGVTARALEELAAAGKIVTVDYMPPSGEETAVVVFAPATTSALKAGKKPKRKTKRKPKNKTAGSSAKKET